MELKKASVYLIAQTKLNKDVIKQYFEDIGNPEWSIDSCKNDGQNLIELAGRVCYRAWQPYDETKPNATNPNVTRVREGNHEYIENILKQKHGSVLEHVYATFILKDVSRILTHELVRHRTGMSYSQESLRYVRLDHLNFYLPEAFNGNQKAIAKVKEVVEFLEQVQVDLADIFDINNIKDFAIKKKLTSAFRRLAPEGLLTTIVVTGNLRAWRHIIELRTSLSAEEEIRDVTASIADLLIKEYPAVFSDVIITKDREYKFQNNKI